ncbi:MAG: CDP-glycerol glycerophosphotransferase family protein, partial [Candidatus Thermoplasmatota archaeon]|nr:CDP-glycerol glycerophosphotransferase family protein [Candidatus Thermoplasmatota archaeon]
HEDEPDLHQIFTKSDILITDYSSAFIDWLILDRPVIFAPYDLLTYQSENGFLEDYRNLVPQPICMEADEILVEIERNILDKDRHQDNRRRAADRYLGNGSLGICERITDIIKNPR